MKRWRIDFAYRNAISGRMGLGNGEEQSWS